MGLLLLLIHIIVCFVLIMVVLLQSGKAADLAGAFGGGGSQTALGSRGAASFLSKATTTCAIVFMLTSMGLALLGSRRTGSVLEQVPAATTAPLPVEVGGEGGASGAPAEGTGAQGAGQETAPSDAVQEPESDVEAPQEEGADDPATER